MKRAIPWILLTVVALLWASAVWNNKVRPLETRPKLVISTHQATVERQMFLFEPRYFARASDGTRCGISFHQWWKSEDVVGKEWGCANGWMKPGPAFGEQGLTNSGTSLVAPAPSPWSNP